MTAVGYISSTKWSSACATLTKAMVLRERVSGCIKLVLSSGRPPYRRILKSELVPVSFMGNVVGDYLSCRPCPHRRLSRIPQLIAHLDAVQFFALFGA